MSAPPLLLFLLFPVAFKVPFGISGGDGNVRIRAIKIPLAGAEDVDTFLLVVAVTVPGWTVVVRWFRGIVLGLFEYI